jgi:general secretion pathway protein A
MYCGHFGLSEKPFEMTPDPKYLYLSPNHREVFAAILYGIRDRRGLTSIVGEVGTGKTTLLNAALQELDEKTKAAYIFNTRVTFEELLNTVLFEMELKKSDENLSKTHAIERLNQFAHEQLTAEGNVALIIDEAQNLDIHSLENLVLLSNLETRKHKLIQLVIAGQPELDKILRRYELRQLTQRIHLKRYLIPLTEKETSDYIRHRLHVADYSGSHLFDRRAQQLIWEYSHGIPRRINILCDNALLIGYGVEKKRITASLMEEAIKDLTWSPFAPANVSSDPIATPAVEKRRRAKTGSPPRRWSMAAGLMLIATIFFGLGLILGRGDLGWRESISRLPKLALQSLKTIQGGSAAGTPTAARPVEEVQAGKNPASDAARIPAEKTEAEPVQGQKAQTEPVPALAVATTPAPAEEGEAATVSAEALEAAGVPAEGIGTADVPAEKVDPALTAAGPKANFLPESLGKPAETIKEAPASANEEEKKEPDTSQALKMSQQRQPLERFIRPGDTLTSIIKEHYGSFDKETLRAVLHENPGIQDPDRILAGEILRLPLPSEKP